MPSFAKINFYEKAGEENQQALNLNLPPSDSVNSECGGNEEFILGGKGVTYGKKVEAPGKKIFMHVFCILNSVFFILNWVFCILYFEEMGK